MKMITAQIISNSEAICSDIKKTIPLISITNAKTRIIDEGIMWNNAKSQKSTARRISRIPRIFTIIFEDV